MIKAKVFGSCVTMQSKYYLQNCEFDSNIGFTSLFSAVGENLKERQKAIQIEGKTNRWKPK